MNYARDREGRLLTVRDQMGVSRGECMYVADNPWKDFASPADLGWITVRIRREHGLHWQLAPAT
jgi:FMN phosphatase YigB (HAD superfamily)